MTTVLTTADPSGWHGGGGSPWERGRCGTVLALAAVFTRSQLRASSGQLDGQAVCVDLLVRFDIGPRELLLLSGAEPLRPVEPVVGGEGFQEVEHPPALGRRGFEAGRE